MLAERAAPGPLELILSDGVIGADWSWSQRAEAMARRIQIRLHQQDGQLLLDLPAATEATVPQRP